MMILRYIGQSRQRIPLPYLDNCQVENVKSLAWAIDQIKAVAITPKNVYKTRLPVHKFVRMVGKSVYAPPGKGEEIRLVSDSGNSIEISPESGKRAMYLPKFDVVVFYDKAIEQKIIDHLIEMYQKEDEKLYEFLAKPQPAGHSGHYQDLLSLGIRA